MQIIHSKKDRLVYGLAIDSDKNLLGDVVIRNRKGEILFQVPAIEVRLNTLKNGYYILTPPAVAPVEVLSTRGALDLRLLYQ